ncbi:MAG: Cof-type HAD-IIB family hydrolase [Lachnospiraceae bacterium]
MSIRYKIIACDLDETLLDDNHKISAKNREVIRKAGELGVKFVPATGRGFNTVDDTLQELGLFQKEQEYVISFNGGAITENKNDRLLHFQGIPFETAQALYLRGLQYDVCIHVYTKDVVYVYNYVQAEKDYVGGRMPIQETFEPNLDFLNGQEIVKMLYMNMDQSYLRQIEEDLKDITDDIAVSYSSNRYIEFNRKGINKGQGLLSLAGLLGVKPEETIAIGDNFNDLSMIQVAGLGVGVRNAAEGIRPYCDYITTATNNESAVAEVIEKFVLNE